MIKMYKHKQVNKIDLKNDLKGVTGDFDLKVSCSQANIDESFANYFLKPKLSTSAL